ncbi:MAG TPA: hypothetical protein VF753_20355 [Terriglobales bacterium]
MSAAGVLKNRLICGAETKRLWRVVQKLLRHDISGWALTGGIAVEIHCLPDGIPALERPLNDVDFVAASFNCAPETLTEEFWFLHVHPHEPPGKTILQLVDAENELRIDLFRAYGAMMTRATFLEFSFGTIQLISKEDVLARTARVLLDLRQGIPVAAKHANDYFRLRKHLQNTDLEAAWQDHRKPWHPVMFREADELVEGLIGTHHTLLITPQYSRNVTEACCRCAPTPAFPLADRHTVLSLLGHC